MKEQDYPLVSVIMPAYNTEKYISEAIESVIRQTYWNWELIVVDDGSTDNTAIILKEYTNKDQRIKYFYQENQKQAKARNTGISYSNGELIAFLDADDLWLPAKLEVSINEFIKGTQDILYSNAYIIEDNKNFEISDSSKTIGAQSGFFSGLKGLSEFLHHNQVPILTVIAKKKAILEVNGFQNENKDGAEDYALWLELLAKGYSIRGTNDNLACYRIHDNSTTRNNNMELKVILMLQRFFIKHSNLITIFKSEILTWYKKAAMSVKDKDELLLLFNSKNLKIFGFQTFETKIIEPFKKLIPEKYLRKLLCRHIWHLENEIND